MLKIALKAKSARVALNSIQKIKFARSQLTQRIRQQLLLPTRGTLHAKNKEAASVPNRLQQTKRIRKGQVPSKNQKKTNNTIKNQNTNNLESRNYKKIPFKMPIKFKNNN